MLEKLAVNDEGQTNHTSAAVISLSVSYGQLRLFYPSTHMYTPYFNASHWASVGNKQKVLLLSNTVSAYLLLFIRHMHIISKEIKDAGNTGLTCDMRKDFIQMRVKLAWRFCSDVFPPHSVSDVKY